MTARGDGFEALWQPDMERRLAELLRVGTVVATDYSNPRKPRVRVKSGKVTTGWIAWAPRRAGRARTWEPLHEGEQVLIASPSGDMAQGIIVGSVNYADRPAPSTSASETVTEWDGGAREAFDDASNTYTLDVPAGGKIILRCGASSLEISDSGIKLLGPRIDLNE